MSTDHLVVVGAGLAGIRACESARRGGFTGALTLVGSETHLPYDRPPLSKELLLADDEPALPELRENSFLREELGVDVRTDSAATGVDVEARVLNTAAGDLGYDATVIAVGAHARRLPGTEHIRGVHTVRTFGDTQSIWRALRARARVVVVGAGFIGAEVASAARKLGLSVTIVEAAPAPLTRSLGVAGGALCADLHERNGTELVLGVGVSSLRTSGGHEPVVTGVELADGRVLDADLVVVGVGAVPSTQWLAGTGVALNGVDGGVECSETLAVLDNAGQPIPGLWAAGDVAHWHNALFDRRMRLEHWTSAAEQGACAARNAIGTEAGVYETVPYFWSDWYGTRLQFVGVPDADEILVQDRADKSGGTVVLYRGGDTVAGVLTIGRPDLIMKYRRLVAKRAPWADGVAYGADLCRA